MFSQLSSFANKLSLDNLQDDDKETAASETQPATGAADEGGGVSSLLGMAHPTALRLMNPHPRACNCRRAVERRQPLIPASPGPKDSASAGRR